MAHFHKIWRSDASKHRPICKIENVKPGWGDKTNINPVRLPKLGCLNFSVRQPHIIISLRTTTLPLRSGKQFDLNWQGGPGA